MAAIPPSPSPFAIESVAPSAGYSATNEPTPYYYSNWNNHDDLWGDGSNWYDFDDDDKDDWREEDEGNSNSYMMIFLVVIVVFIILVVGRRAQRQRGSGDVPATVHPQQQQRQRPDEENEPFPEERMAVLLEYIEKHEVCKTVKEEDLIYGADSNKGVEVVRPEASEKEEEEEEEVTIGIEQGHPFSEERPPSRSSVLVADYLQVTAMLKVRNACAVCLAPYEVGESVVWSPNINSCSHAFHFECIISWLAKTKQQGAPCPICRQEFIGKEPDT